MAAYSASEPRPIIDHEAFLQGASKKHSYSLRSPPTPSISPPESVATHDIPEDFELCLHHSRPQLDVTVARESLQHGLHVLNTEAQAMINLKKIYDEDTSAQEAFVQSVETIRNQKATKSKLVIVGVGKSGHVGKKMTATFQSLGIRATFLHPTEALHGDLGFVDADDTVLFVTYSGKTQELLLLLPHLHRDQAIIVLTSHLRREACEIVRLRPTAVMLPAPLIEPEAVSFGVAAPTTSTTISMALGDALAVATSHALHPSVSVVFAKNHPGGAIGVAHRTPKKLEDICTVWKDMFVVDGLTGESLGIDLFRAGYSSSSEWIRFGAQVTSKSKVGQLSIEDFNKPLGDLSSVFVAASDMMLLPSSQDIQAAAEGLREVASCGTGELDSMIGLMKGEELYGVVSTSKILSWPI